MDYQYRVDNFYSKESKLRELILSKNWNDTPLKNAESWPVELSTMLSMVMANPMAMCIFWGSDFIQIFNDSYAEVLGASNYIKALGASAKDTFGDKWQEISSVFERVMSGESAELSGSFLIAKNGVLEEKFYDFTYSPIYKVTGEVLGVLCTVVEITEKKLLEQKLLDNTDTLHYAIEAVDLGTWDFNPLTNKFTANSILKSWLGLSFEDEIDLQTVTACIVQEDQLMVAEAIQDAIQYETETQYTIEYTIVNPKTGKKRDVFSKGKAWFTDDKICYRLNGTLEDVTDIRTAQRKIEENEKRFRDYVEQAPMGITVFKGDNHVVEMANHNYLAMVDKKEEDFVGRPLFESLPEVQEFIEQILLDIKKTGGPFYGNEFPVKLNRYGKIEHTYFNFVYYPLKEEDGQITGIMVVANEVTATVKAKHILQESEKHFRNMVMQSPIAMTVLKGENHIIESANKVMFEYVWRKKSEDVLGRSILDVFPELRDQKFATLLDSVFTSGKAHSEKEAEAVVSGDDGTRKFYLDFEYAPLFYTEETVSGIIITVNDVTDRVEARLKVEENESRLNIVIEASSLGVWEYDMKTGESIVSERCFEIFGPHNRSQLTVDDLIARFHSNDSESIKDAYKSSFETGKLYYEANFKGDDGSTRWIEVNGKVFFDSQKNAEKIVGTIRDITDEKNFHKLLLEREEKFRLLADSMPQLVWTSDKEGNLDYYNKTVFAYSGLTLEKFLNEGWLQIVHPDDKEENIRAWNDSIQSGEDFHFEHRLRKKDGTYRWQLSRAIPQIDDQGNIKMWVGSSTDIQEQIEFTEELEKQVNDRTRELHEKNDDLEKMNKELQSFAYISSHDLQEPLRKIQTFSSLLLEDEYLNMSDRGKDMFERMQKAAQRMQTLIQDLLLYSRTNTQQRVFNQTSLVSIVDEVKEYLKEELQNKDVKLDLTVSCDVSVIRFQFRQLLLNLISNSIKFSDPSRGLHINIDCEMVNSDVLEFTNTTSEQLFSHIRFTDNGIGFDQKYNEKIFDVFQRLHGKNEYAGTGIGLAIVKKIVDNHRGYIRATGKQGLGATFDIYLPA